jgi:hypothetical protein
MVIEMGCFLWGSYEITDARRKRAGGIAPPADAENEIEKVINAAFSEAEQNFKVAKISLDDLLIRFMVTIENNLIDELSYIASVWRLKKKEIITVDAATEELTKQLDEAFMFVTNLATEINITLDDKQRIVILMLKRTVFAGCRRLIRGWK